MENGPDGDGAVVTAIRRLFLLHQRRWAGPGQPCRSSHTVVTLQLAVTARLDQQCASTPLQLLCAGRLSCTAPNARTGGEWMAPMRGIPSDDIGGMGGRALPVRCSEQEQAVSAEDVQAGSVRGAHIDALSDSDCETCTALVDRVGVGYSLLLSHCPPTQHHEHSTPVTAPQVSMHAATVK